MKQTKRIYQWSKQDRLLHLVPAIPLILFHIGTIYLLAVQSFYLVGGYVLLWAATNLAITGICAGCPYRGGYCPGVSQLYFAPFLPAWAYKTKRNNSLKQSFRVNLFLLGVFGLGSYIFAFYWLFTFYWDEYQFAVLILLGLLLLHMPLSFFMLCPKCSYNDTCPMAKVHKLVKEKGSQDKEKRDGAKKIPMDNQR